MHPVVEACQQALSLFRVEVLKIALGQIAVTVALSVFADYCNRELSQDADRWHNHFVIVAAVLAADVINFRLEANQHIANFTLDKAGGGTTTAGIKHRYIG